MTNKQKDMKAELMCPVKCPPQPSNKYRMDLDVNV